MAAIESLVPVWTPPVAGVQALQRPVRFEMESLQLQKRGELISLSVNEAQIFPDIPLALYSRVPVKLRFRFGETVFTLTGETGRSQADSRFSLAFDGATRDYMARLAPMLQAAGLMEHDPGPDLSGLFGEGAREDAQKPASPGNPALVQQLGPPGGIERRAARRYLLETSVCMTLLESGRNVRCSLVELSVSGCRLHVADSASCKPGQEVEVSFCGYGLPIQLKGRVQNLISAHLLGIRYTEVSCQNREYLLELVQNLAGREKSMQS